MANIILPAVPVLSEIDDSAKLLIEQAGEINRYPISDLDSNLAVLYVEQTLTDAQQRQARKNIRCGIVGNTIGCVASGLYSSAQGGETEAASSYSHAEGNQTRASGSMSHAEGYGSWTFGSKSHAEGNCTQAIGEGSHAEGYCAKTNGDYSHAEGYGTYAKGDAQHVQGKYNKREGAYAHIVGNGTADDARSNAHTLDWDGVPWYAGDRVMLGGTSMDDAEAVALMPIFVPQQLTPEQQKQACENIGTKKTVVMTATLGEYTSFGYGGEYAVENVSMTYDEVREAVNAGAQVECHVTFTENQIASNVLTECAVFEQDGCCLLSCYFATDTDGWVGTLGLEQNGNSWFATDAFLTARTLQAEYLTPNLKQSFTEEQKAQARTNIGAASVADVIAALPLAKEVAF